MKCYLVANHDKTICKIGVTRNVERRVRIIATFCPFPIQLLHTRPGFRDVEAAIHRALIGDRIHGEWFRMMPHTVETFNETAARSRAEPCVRELDGLAGVFAAHGVVKLHLAKALGITHGAVNQWRRVPAERVIDVERATGIPREKLRPDLYPSERAA